MKNNKITKLLSAAYEDVALTSQEVSLLIAAGVQFPEACEPNGLDEDGRQLYCDYATTDLRHGGTGVSKVTIRRECSADAELTENWPPEATHQIIDSTEYFVEEYELIAN